MYHHFFILIILFFDIVSSQSIARGDQVYSFTVDLIHRDSPESPFYNRSLTPSKLLAKDVMRYRTGVDGLNSSSAYMDDKNMVPSHQEKRKLFESEITMNDRNDYVITNYVGSNKVPGFLYVDLTANFVWTKCDMSEKSRERYDPRLSSLFSRVGSDSAVCEWLSDDIKVHDTSKACSFKYKDIRRQSEANGVIIKDIFYFSKSQTDAHTVYFGCDDSDRRDEYDIGLLGMGRGQMSFIGQHNVIDKFSYCLLPDSTSKIIFGNLPKETQSILVPSPLEPITDEAYYLNLKGVEVGDSKIVEPFADGMIAIRIDFGTKWTFLEESVYEHVKENVRQIVNADPITKLEYGLCYKKEDLEGIEFQIVFHFEQSVFDRHRKASITVNSTSVFAEENVEGGDDEYCMTLRKLESDDEEPYSVFGSLAQMGHVMQFDVTRGLVSFAPMDCNLF